MPFNQQISIFVIVSDSDGAFFLVEVCENWYIGVGTEGTETLRVIVSVYGIEQPQIGKVIDIDAVLKDYHDLVFPEPHRLDESLETQLSDALVLMIVPEKHFVHGKLWVLSTADESQDIASEKHLDNSDAAIELWKKVWLEKAPYLSWRCL